MYTKINKIESDWVDVKNKCRTTVNKDHTDNIPNSEFKTKLLISEHSPIRLIKVNWIWRGIKSWVATHWSRHKWECFISTQRSDRIGQNRDDFTQGQLVNFEGEANAQHLIDTMRKRLCFQASKETRELAVELKLMLKGKESELADVLVPNCVYRCGCSEFEQCKFWGLYLTKIDLMNLGSIKSRYDVYNREFYNTYRRDFE